MFSGEDCPKSLHVFFLFVQTFCPGKWEGGSYSINHILDTLYMRLVSKYDCGNPYLLGAVMLKFFLNIGLSFFCNFFFQKGLALFIQ